MSATVSSGASRDPAVDSTRLVQKRFGFRSQTFELAPDDVLHVTIRSLWRQSQFAFRLREFKPQPGRVQARAIVPAIVGVFTSAVSVMAFVGSFAEHGSDSIVSVFVGSVFGSFAFLAWRTHQLRNCDVIAYYSASSGRALVTPWYRKPDRQRFESYFAELTQRIERAHKYAWLEAPSDLER